MNRFPLLAVVLPTLLALGACGADPVDPPGSVPGASSSSTSSSSSSAASSSTSSSSTSSSSGGSGGQTMVLQERQPGLCAFDGAIETEHDGATGSGYINSDNAVGAAVTWRIDAAEAGTYDAVLRWANGGVERAAELVINEGANGRYPLQFATGQWTDWMETALTIDLNEGENTLQLVATVADGLANVDRLALVGAATVGVACEPAPPPAPDNSARGSACTMSTGTVSVTSPIVVDGDFDGGCRTFLATYGDGSQQEGQDPVFRVNGGTLSNVIVGPNGDGIHIYGDATLTNISWPDVAEDALTIKAEADLTISNFEAYSAADKVFQLNARSTFTASNCTVRNMGKMFRENGEQCYPVDVSVDNCSIDTASDAVFRSDCAASVWRISNSTVTNARVCYSGTANCDADPN